MPISRSEFEMGQVSPELLVVEFLYSDQDQAYSLGELWHALGSRVALSIDEFQELLSGLVREQRIGSKTISDKLYYICSKRLGF